MGTWFQADIEVKGLSLGLGFRAILSEERWHAFKEHDSQRVEEEFGAGS